MQASSNLKSVTIDNILASPQPFLFGETPTLGILLKAGMLGAAAGCLKRLANVGTTSKMTQGTWSQLFIIIKSQIFYAEVGNDTGKRQEVLSSVFSGLYPTNSLAFFLFPFKHNGKGERKFWTKQCQFLFIRILFLNLGKHH